MPNDKVNDKVPRNWQYFRIRPRSYPRRDFRSSVPVRMVVRPRGNVSERVPFATESFTSERPNVSQCLIAFILELLLPPSKEPSTTPPPPLAKGARPRLRGFEARERKKRKKRRGGGRNGTRQWAAGWLLLSRRKQMRRFLAGRIISEVSGHYCRSVCSRRIKRRARRKKINRDDATDAAL